MHGTLCTRRFLHQNILTLTDQIFDVICNCLPVCILSPGLHLLQKDFEWNIILVKDVEEILEINGTEPHFYELLETSLMHNWLLLILVSVYSGHE